MKKYSCLKDSKNMDLEIGVKLLISLEPTKLDKMLKIIIILSMQKHSTFYQ